MAEVARHTRVRDVNGPRAVDGNRASLKRRRSLKADSGHRRKRSQHVPADSFELRVLDQPIRRIALGATIDTSVLLSLKLPHGERPVRSSSIDTSGLWAATSLVAEMGNGDKMPLEMGSITGQKMFDSVHDVPERWAGWARNLQGTQALGIFSFPGLLIRQPGTYRVRITLVKMSDVPGRQDASSVVMVDSDPIKVLERWPRHR